MTTMRNRRQNLSIKWRQSYCS